MRNCKKKLSKKPLEMLLVSGSTTLVRTGICFSAPLVAGEGGLVSDSTSFFTTTSETLSPPLLLMSSFAEGSPSEATSLEFNAGDGDLDAAVDTEMSPTWIIGCQDILMAEQNLLINLTSRRIFGISPGFFLTIWNKNQHRLSMIAH